MSHSHPHRQAAAEVLRRKKQDAPDYSIGFSKDLSTGKLKPASGLYLPKGAFGDGKSEIVAALQTLEAKAKQQGALIGFTEYYTDPVPPLPMMAPIPQLTVESVGNVIKSLRALEDYTERAVRLSAAEGGESVTHLAVPPLRGLEALNGLILSSMIGHSRDTKTASIHVHVLKKNTLCHATLVVGTMEGFQPAYAAVLPQDTFGASNPHPIDRPESINGTLGEALGRIEADVFRNIPIVYDIAAAREPVRESSKKGTLLNFPRATAS